MSGSVALTGRRLSLAAAERRLERVPGGAVVLFAGRVRADRHAGGRTRALDYEADRVPALAELRRLEREAQRRFGTREVVLWHRLGRVPVGATSVVVGVVCGHRAEAFAAARFLIDELKASVPIWKTERARPERRPRPPRARPRRRSAG